MTESEFLNLSDAMFARIENVLDQADLDLDCLILGNVLEIETDDGEKIIVNRHVPNQELWIASKAGGFHFGWQAGEWIDTRSGQTFGVSLKQALENLTGETLPDHLLV